MLVEVQVWMSEWGHLGGIVGSADRVVLRRRSLFRKLGALGTVHSASGDGSRQRSNAYRR